MEKFIEKFQEKWKNDKKFQAKMKLLGYTIFIVAVSIYASVINAKIDYNDDILNNDEEINNEVVTDLLNIPEEYEYTITIEINDKKYEYTGKKTETREFIEKTIDDTTTKYMYYDNQYYVEDNMKIDNYIITTKDEVYDVVNYNYINLKTINEYIKKATKNDNHYLVYLKDVILGNDSDEYFTIDVNEEKIFIDYTTLMQEFNKEINKYQVNIEIKEKE